MFSQAVSYSTGLETSRPRTCLGIASARAPPAPPAPAPPTPNEEERLRGKLDKSHSTPAYDFAPAEPALHPPIPESPPVPAAAPAPPATPVTPATPALVDLPANSDAPSVSALFNFSLVSSVVLIAKERVSIRCCFPNINK